ncbi:MAG: PLP-dependent aminotransferase family protein [Planctomycetes bacterium]|nr:PLP-dependent aminotransferase family protein [Planctomycetota bacterium]
MGLASFSFSGRSNRTPESPISYFMEQAIENPNLISLAAGLVDTDSLPVKAVADTMARLFADPQTGKAALQYGTTQGYTLLREKILQHVCNLDGVKPEQLNLTAQDVVVSTGSQQLLYLLSEILLDPGDIVITEAPSYFVYHSVLASGDVRVLTVPMDEEGMQTEELARLLEQLDRAGELHRVKLLYVVDYFQNPSGRSLSPERRKELLNIVRRYQDRQRILILEDAAYRELRFEGDDWRSIKSHDTGNEFVIYAGTFSKPCAPGLKTGYALLPSELIEPLLRLKGNHDFGSNNLSQYVLNALIENGAYHEQVRYLAGVYRQKRDAMLEALEREFSDLPGTHWTSPRGGMFVWLTLPEDINAGPSGKLLKECIREGVIYVPGEFGHVGKPGTRPTNEARLSYGDASIEKIHEGIKRLRRAVETVRRGEKKKERVAVAAS